MHSRKPQHYMPTLKYHGITRFCDMVVRFITRKNVFKTELFCALKSGERLHSVDREKLSPSTQRILLYIIPLLDDFNTIQDNITDMLPKLIKDWQLIQPEKKRSLPAPLGKIWLFKVTKT